MNIYFLLIFCIQISFTITAYSRDSSVHDQSNYVYVSEGDSVLSPKASLVLPSSYSELSEALNNAIELAQDTNVLLFDWYKEKFKKLKKRIMDKVALQDIKVIHDFWDSVCTKEKHWMIEVFSDKNLTYEQKTHEYSQSIKRMKLYRGLVAKEALFKPIAQSHIEKLKEVLLQQKTFASDVKQFFISVQDLAKLIGLELNDILASI